MSQSRSQLPSALVLRTLFVTVVVLVSLFGSASADAAGAPTAKTEAATQVLATQATLHGTVNPNGSATTYWFECGKTTAYGTKVPSAGKEAGSGSSNVAVSETYKSLEPSTTYHCRLVAENSFGTAKGEDTSFTTQAAGTELFVGRLDVANVFDASASSLADFESSYGAVGWATSLTPKGEDTSSGWRGVGTSGKLSGAYYTPTISDVGWGLAGAVTLAELPGTEQGLVSLWADMPTPASATKAGYQLQVKFVTSTSYTLTLSKWVSGTQTELASKSGYALAKGDSIALVDLGGTVSAWIDTGSGYSQLISAADSTYEGGNIGFTANGSIPRLTNFKAGALRSPQTTTEAASNVRATTATAKGTVNPTGHESTFWFEYGTTSAYGSKTEAELVIGEEISDIPVAEILSNLSPSTTYHFRLVAESDAGRNYGHDLTFTTEGTGTELFLARLDIANAFDAGASSLADFGSSYGAVGWATSTTPKGEDTASGWKGVGTNSKLSGAYYTPTISDVGWGLGGAVTMAEPPGVENVSFSLWADMPTPASTKAGYQLEVKYVTSTSYTLTLSKWVGGTQTELASKTGYALAKGNSVALVDMGSTVSAWVDSGSGYTQVVSATDSTFKGGNIGFDAAGSVTRLTNFKAGALRSPQTTTEAATSVQSTKATLNGTVNPTAHESTFWFEYGTTTAYGSKTEAELVIGEEISNIPVAEVVSGLKSKTTYHFRLVAESEAGKNYGHDLTFTTP